ncbi:hypothetical protein D5086_014245 [Populus alba]|uniref:Uncharacterized protein n=1 Tax=Populus alba TaxID=43335 RepID=A0ACC4BWZ4_POPAL
MTSTTDERSFLDIDEGSDEEMFESFGEHEASQDGLLQQCISQRVVDNGMILTESSVENLSVDGLEPYTGMTFPSLDDARDFYYEYAKRTALEFDNYDLKVIASLFCDHPLHTQVRIIAKEEKDKKIQDLSGELQHERERSASFQQQLCMILKDLKEHEEFLSLRVEDIIKTLKEIELGVL